VKDITSLDCIVHTVETKGIKVFGMQKCGTGTLTEYIKDDARIEFGHHGTFIDRTISDKSVLKFYDSSVRSAIDRAGVFRRQYKLDNEKVNVAMVRNPFDLLASFYFHGRNGSNNIGGAYGDSRSSSPGFKKFIRSFETPSSKFHFIAFHLGAFYPYYAVGGCGDGQFMPDYACKLEHLDTIIEHLGVWDQAKAEHAAEGLLSHNSTRPSPNIDMYDDHMVATVNKFFGYELEFFGYNIEGSTDDRICISKSEIPNLEESRINFFTKIARGE